MHKGHPYRSWMDVPAEVAAAKRLAVVNFRRYIRPAVIEKFGEYPEAMHVAWDNYVEAMYKEGKISKEMSYSWTMPEEMIYKGGRS